MATAKIRLDVVTLLRLSGIGAFVGLSLLVYYLSVPQSIATLLQLGILLSYGALMTGVITKRPDFEVLAWLLWYNRRRMHSTLNYLSPAEFESRGGSTRSLAPA